MQDESKKTSIQSKIVEQIRVLRRELSINQPHLADIAGISVNSLYRIERGAG